MSYFAKVVDGVVVNVIVAEPEFFDSFVDSSPGKWIPVEIQAPSGKEREARNVAGIGYMHDEVTGAFFSPSPFPSWKLNKTTYTWEPPVPRPASGEVLWDEVSGSWREPNEDSCGLKEASDE